MSLSKKEIDKIIRVIPGYDPVDTAGDCYFDYDAANVYVEFIETCCTHTKGPLAGKPFLMEDWEKAIVLNLFGWKRNKDDLRRYREVLLYIPRKNGKTILGASISNAIFFLDDEKGAEIYAAAAEREQASLIWNMAKYQILGEKEMQGRCKIYNASRSITKEADGSFFKPISADGNSKHGFNAHAIFLDELHAQKTPELTDVLVTSTGARLQPIIFYTTTSDFDRPSVCNQKHDYAVKVRDGDIEDETFLPVIYEAGFEDDWTDPEIWAKANPNLGISITYEYLEKECKKAQELPSYQNTFKRLHLNIKTEQDVRWILMDIWDQCKGDIEPEMLLGKKCIGGLDLASVSDLCAFDLYFPDYKALLCWFWVPRLSAIRRKEKNKINYLGWAAENKMELTEGDVADYDHIRKRINEIGTLYNIQEIAIDRWNSTQLQTQLAGDGFEIVPYGQGFASMSAPTKELERLILNRELVHFDHPVLRWNASNVSIEMDPAENIKPSKKKSFEKIDGVVAGIMAIGRALVLEINKGSVYEQREIFTI